LIDEFIPQITKSQAHKQKRSSFWHFFGAVTTEDVKILQDNIANLQTATEISLRSFATTTEKYSSFMNLTTEHLQNLGATLLKQTTNTHKHLRHGNAAITFLFGLILAQSEYSDASLLLHKFELQLRQLLAGQLPRGLITPHMLENVRSNISMFLKQYEVLTALASAVYFSIHTKTQILHCRGTTTKFSLRCPSRYP
jgi:hypothetical protein